MICFFKRPGRVVCCSGIGSPWGSSSRFSSFASGFLAATSALTQAEIAKLEASSSAAVSSRPQCSENGFRIRPLTRPARRGSRNPSAARRHCHPFRGPMAIPPDVMTAGTPTDELACAASADQGKPWPGLRKLTTQKAAFRHHQPSTPQG